MNPSRQLLGLIRREPLQDLSTANRNQNEQAPTSDRKCFSNSYIAGRSDAVSAETTVLGNGASGRIGRRGKCRSSSLTREHASTGAKFAQPVSDAWHGQGLGTELLRRLLSLPHKDGISHGFGDILAENNAMQDICRQLGFDMRYSVEDRVIKASPTFVESSP